MTEEVYSDDFKMNNFKVEVCVLTHPHIWKTCPYVHAGEPIKRRPHNVHHPDLCPDVKRGRMCSYGPERCYWAHNTFESWLHPERYRTIMCRDGPKCNRAICFFAHSKRQASQIGWVEDLSATQHDLGVFGTVAEIGVHHGKFFLPIMGFSAREEPAIALDLFEQQGQNFDASGE
eukprot:gene4385-4639_t